MTDRLNEGAEACAARPRVSGDEFDDGAELLRIPVIGDLRAGVQRAAAGQIPHPSFFDDGEGNFACKKD